LAHHWWIFIQAGHLKGINKLGSRDSKITVSVLRPIGTAFLNVGQRNIISGIKRFIVTALNGLAGLIGGEPPGTMTACANRSAGFLI
jgi:hypothetical protein